MVILGRNLLVDLTQTTHRLLPLVKQIAICLKRHTRCSCIGNKKKELQQLIRFYLTPWIMTRLIAEIWLKNIVVYKKVDFMLVVKFANAIATQVIKTLVQYFCQCCKLSSLWCTKCLLHENQFYYHYIFINDGFQILAP